MNPQIITWGLTSLFKTTPPWASKTVSVLLALIGIYGAFILKYPDVVPIIWQAKIGAVAGMLTWGFQMFGHTPATNSATAMEMISAPDLTEHDVKRVMLEVLNSAMVTSKSDQPVEAQQITVNNIVSPKPGI
jgi:hypothetical protein